MKSKLLLISDSRELFWYCSRKLSGQCEILHSKIQDYKKVLLLAEVLSVICVILDTSSLDSSATHEIRDFVADNFDCTFFTVDSAFGPLPLEVDSLCPTHQDEKPFLLNPQVRLFILMTKRTMLSCLKNLQPMKNRSFFLEKAVPGKATWQK